MGDLLNDNEEGVFRAASNTQSVTECLDSVEMTETTTLIPPYYQRLTYASKSKNDWVVYVCSKDTLLLWCLGIYIFRCLLESKRFH
jgi:hypothetical protein